jgi:curli biogenesis system outer membrane secretion channel CsgG
VAICLASVVLLAGCGPSFKIASETVQDQEFLKGIKRIAVLPLSSGLSLSGDIHIANAGEAVSGFLIGEALKSKVFDVVERSQLDKIMAERNLKTSDLVDNPARAAELGKLAGADAIILGEVSEYAKQRDTIHIYIIPVIIETYKVSAGIRIVSVQDVKIVYYAAATATSGGSFSETGTAFGGGLFNRLKEIRTGEAVPAGQQPSQPGSGTPAPAEPPKTDPPSKLAP